MKEVRDFYGQFDSCRESHMPLCAEGCPFHLDILTFMDRICSGRFNPAYKAYRDSVAFPGIVSRICPGYCQKHCIRANFDDALNLPLLEKSVIDLATRTTPNAYNLPSKNEKIAVIGGGISGMAFALKMASRKYDVTIFEQNASIGGHLRELLDEEIYMSEFNLQLQNEKYTLLLNSKASVILQTGEINVAGAHETVQVYDDFSVIYIATGDGSLESLGFEKSTAPAFIDACGTGIFLGGSMMGLDTMHALADGINTSLLADTYIKTGSYEAAEALAPSGCIPNEDLITFSSAITPGDGAPSYSKEECISEASRCVRCKCDACESSCDVIKYYKKSPAKLRDEIFLSVKPAGSLVHKCPSRKYIAACTQCEFMEGACPEHIDLCGMIKSARHQMHKVEKMPAAYRQYFLRDMDFANGEFAKIVRGGGEYAFFPGCNLGALNPEYVIGAYKWLIDKVPDTGLLLRCCGIPADWAGNSLGHAAEIESLRNDWISMGKPTLITACMSCDKHLHEYLPEIDTISFYEFYASHSLIEMNTPVPEGDGAPTFTIFDPCSARGLDAVQAAVRDLAQAHGVRVEELPKNDLHGCCGYGGQGAIAQPEFTKFVTDERSSLSDNPYLVYCSNCRDVFNDSGKRAIHILDLLLNIDPAGVDPAPGLTDRRANRVSLKERLLKEIWNEEMKSKPAKSKYSLVMSDEISAKMERLHILYDDVCSVIEHAETSGRRTQSLDSGHYKAYNEIGAITLWVEYEELEDKSPESNGAIRRIHNLYSHRMQIKLEAVFNGKKID